MGTHAIPLMVADERELYEGFDPQGRTLSPSLVAYLEARVDERSLGDRVRVDVASRTPVDAGRLEEALRQTIAGRREGNRREIARKRAGAFRLLAIGVAFVLAGVASAPFASPVVAAIISTVGSFSIWEASSVWIEVLPELRRRERLLDLLAEAGFTYKEGVPE